LPSIAVGPPAERPAPYRAAKSSAYLSCEHWLGPRSALFNIAILAGAILAAVLIYRQRLWQLLDSSCGPAGRRPCTGSRGATM